MIIDADFIIDATLCREWTDPNSPDVPSRSLAAAFISSSFCSEEGSFMRSTNSFAADNISLHDFAEKNASLLKNSHIELRMAATKMKANLPICSSG
jgi:hypothetical protein